MPAVFFHGDVAEHHCKHLRETLCHHLGLNDAMYWGLEQTPLRMVDEVVTQDEYTLDVLMPYDDGLWIVYDAT